MARDRSRPPRPRTLNETSVAALIRLLTERGLTEDQIERGLDYIEAVGARTMRDGFELAMSRILYTDHELASGQRFTFPEDAGQQA